ncbi:MAG TPA: trypsin-like peptidase domain-containing protein [Nitrososphaerales archaeon]|nr:trypsin-like peptidase domain-containing protein [Nitrososphaerales archaeon]HUK75514.1 trypsin-like peptidase domain-containing protein [Nitrososphaerales archaeon]
MSSIGILQTISGEIERLAEDVGRSVLSIGSGHGNGSGIAWDEHTIVTAYHVVRGADEVSVATEDGRKLSAKVAGRLRRSDVAVLKVEEALLPIQKGDSAALKVGQFVLAVANPFASRPSVTSGIVTGAARSVGGWWGMSIEDAVITDARVNPGYSGGPLVDASGRMIGMNVAYFSKRGIAVPVNTISKVVSRLADGKPFKRAYLGIMSNPVPLPEEVSSDVRVGQEAGVMVLSVENGTPAKQAGLSFGDVILKFNGQETSSSDDLTSLLGEDAIGKKAKLSVLRGGSVVELEVTPTTGREE